MKVATWNVRGYTRPKQDAVLSFVRYSDIVCLTETWSTITYSEHWNAISTGAPPTGRSSRIRGGVSILHRRTTKFRLIAKYADEHFQMIHGVFNGTPVLGAYVVPHIAKPDFSRFLEIAHRCLKGPGVLLGDLNARHAQWDDTYNCAGRQLQKWARLHNFQTQRPPTPTLRNPRVSSWVDLVFHRHSVPPSIQVLPETPRSDHRPVTATLAATHATPQYTIPLSLVNNSTCCAKVKRRYEQTLPPIIEALKNTTTVASLEINSRRLNEAVITPWIQMGKAKTSTVRPGWTQSLDRKAKLRKRLIKSTDPGDRRRARELDKEMKRKVRSNRRRLPERISAELEGGDPANDSCLLKRALALEAQRDVAPVQVDPDAYTEFMRSLQPDPTQQKVVQLQCFDVPESFRASLTLAIRQKLKPKKSPVPDQIRTEVFKVAPDLFTDAALELWRAIGQIAHTPMIVLCGLLSPIYKQKGDASMPTNNRPVCLTAALRRLIATALRHELQQHYRNSLPN